MDDYVQMYEFVVLLPQYEPKQFHVKLYIKTSVWIHFGFKITIQRQ